LRRVCSRRRAAACGGILTQGHGTIGDHACEPLVMLKHFGPNHPEKP